VLEAARAARTELRNQVSRLEDQRKDLVRDLENSPSTAASGGLEARIGSLDARITALDEQLAQADQAVANAAAVPGATTVPPRPPKDPNAIPEEAVVITVVFTIFVLFPIAVGYARRLWKKGATIIAPVPQEVRERLDQLGTAVDSIALEVERIGEGQRFVTKVMAEGPRALGEGAVPLIPVARAAERAEVRQGDQADWR
jgi:hypothetical protein